MDQSELRGDVPVVITSAALSLLRTRARGVHFSQQCLAPVPCELKGKADTSGLFGCGPFSQVTESEDMVPFRDSRQTASNTCLQGSFLGAVP
jgi:hypothetical protein